MTSHKKAARRRPDMTHRTCIRPLARQLPLAGQSQSPMPKAERERKYDTTGEKCMPVLFQMLGQIAHAHAMKYALPDGAHLFIAQTSGC